MTAKDCSPSVDDDPVSDAERDHAIAQRERIARSYHHAPSSDFDGTEDDRDASTCTAAAAKGFTPEGRA